MKIRKGMMLLALFALPSVAAANTETKSIPRDATDYLQQEASRIRQESVRIKGESRRLNSEAGRLKSESSRLRDSAAHLDSRWEKAHEANPAKYRDFAGRDRSQRIMRSDAEKLNRDSTKLRTDAGALGGESIRLEKLASAVDSEAQREWFRRLKGCCNSHASLEAVRMRIASMARDLRVVYRPQ